MTNETYLPNAQPLETSQIEMVSVSSSNIAAIGYDVEFARLFVEFTSGGTYRYDGVEWGEYDALLRAESVGKYLHANIKGKYATTKVS